MYIAFLIALVGSVLDVSAKLSRYELTNELQSARLTEHTVVTDSNVFPYAAAVLKKQSYLSAGALLDDQWVLTAADALFLVRESTRIIRVRLGSINYKKGGLLLPVKTIEVHPFFDDSRPVFDVALIRLSERVRLSPTVYPIRMQSSRREVTATHFIVTAWAPSMKAYQKPNHPISLDSIKQRRMLSVSHVHPVEASRCAEELAALEVTETEDVMCLDSELRADPCWRDTGAPVVLDGMLWAIVSSWRGDCGVNGSDVSGSHFAGLVAAPEIHGWVRATTRGRQWDPPPLTPKKEQ